jgi:outer membrane murein-binding lipoprotein Lpp
LILFRFLFHRLVVDIVTTTFSKRNCLVKRRLGALVLAGLLLAGCDQSGSDAKHIKVGVINGAEQDVAEVAKKVAKEKYGLDVELVGFSGSLLPNDATNQGDWMPTSSSIARSLQRITRRMATSWWPWRTPLSSRWPAIPAKSNPSRT